MNRTNKGFRRRALVVAAAAAVVPAISQQSAHAQTDYFWNAPTGNSGAWDTVTQMWSSTTTGPVDHIWSNSGSERANFANGFGIVTLDAGGITSAGLIFTV